MPPSLLRGSRVRAKEVMARFLHRKSRRNNGTFVSVNCAAIPEEPFRIELFGHEKRCLYERGSAARWQV